MSKDEMLTFSEHQAFKTRMRDQTKRLCILMNESFVASLVNIPLYEPTPRECEGFEANEPAITRETLRKRLLEGDPLVRCAVVLCDHCRTEIFTIEPTLLSDPPKIRVACPGCGWSGYME